MAHWTEKYVGLPYQTGERDCGSLCETVLREVFDRTLNLPTYRAESLKEQCRQIIDLRDDFGIKTDAPEEGDAVLTWSIKDGVTHWHLGIYCVTNHEPSILHAFIGARQVVLHRIRDLAAYGMNLEGYYKWL